MKNELAKSAVKEIQPLWEAYQRSARRTEEQGLEFGETVYKWRQQFATNGGVGNKGKGITAILQQLNIPERTAYHWINRYEVHEGLKAAPPIAGDELEAPRKSRRSFEPENITPEEDARVDQWYANARTAPPLVLPGQVSEQVLKVAREVVDAGNRALAKTRHPDCGGTQESMRLLNAAVDWLRREIAGA